MYVCIYTYYTRIIQRIKLSTHAFLVYSIKIHLNTLYLNIYQSVYACILRENHRVDVKYTLVQQICIFLTDFVRISVHADLVP